MISYPNLLNLSRLSCKIGLLYIFVFIAGEMITGLLHAITVVDNISSAIPFAILPMIFAEAGAISIASALSVSDTCAT